MPDRLELTSRSRYALMAMLDLAESEQKDPIPLAMIASRRGISLSYLEQMFSGLRKNGLVVSARGPGGGYRLARPADHIAIADIIQAAEDCVPAQRVKMNRQRFKTSGCRSQTLWRNLGDFVLGLLAQISLEDVQAERTDKFNRLFGVGSVK